jgi:hypothetical protein
MRAYICSIISRRLATAMRLSTLLLTFLLSAAVAACSSAPRTVGPPNRPGAVTPPPPDVEAEEEGEPDEDDAPVMEVPVEETPPDTTDAIDREASALRARAGTFLTGYEADLHSHRRGPLGRADARVP